MTRGKLPCTEKGTSVHAGLRYPALRQEWIGAGAAERSEKEGEGGGSHWRKERTRENY